MQVIVTSFFFFFLLIADGRLFQPWFSFLKQQMLYVVNWELFLDQFSLVIVKIEFELGLCNCWFCMFDGIFFIFFFVLLFLFWRVVISNYWYWCDNTANEKWKLFVADFLMFVSVLPVLFPQKSPVLAIFWQKSAFCRHHPCFIAFLCGNVLAKYRQMAKIGDFGHFSVLQNRRFGDKSPLLAILQMKVWHFQCSTRFQSSLLASYDRSYHELRLFLTLD